MHTVIEVHCIHQGSSPFLKHSFSSRCESVLDQVLLGHNQKVLDNHQFQLDTKGFFDYVLTSNGLIYFQTLKRKYLQGKEMTLDEYNKIRLLYVYYATANRNGAEVFAWQDICITLDEKGIFEKDMFLSKEDLKNKSLIIENPHYQSGLFRKYTEHVKENMKK